MKLNGLIMLLIPGDDLLPYEYNIIIATGMMSMEPVRVYEIVVGKQAT